MIIAYNLIWHLSKCYTFALQFVFHLGMSRMLETKSDGYVLVTAGVIAENGRLLLIEDDSAVHITSIRISW